MNMREVGKRDQLLGSPGCSRALKRSVAQRCGGCSSSKPIGFAPIVDAAGLPLLVLYLYL